MARTYHVRFKAPRKRSYRQAKSGEAIVALMVAGVLMLLGMGAMIAVHF